MIIKEVTLRPLAQEDLPKLYEWRNDPEIMARTRQWRELEWSEHQQWFDTLDPNRDLMRMILARSTAPTCYVGVCGLTHIDWVNRNAEVSIYIGDRQYRRKGVGRKAIALLLDMAFIKMNLHKVYAEIYSFNEACMKLFLKCGFSLDCVMRETVYRDGEYCDSHYFDFYKRYYAPMKGL